MWVLTPVTRIHRGASQLPSTDSAAGGAAPAASAAAAAAAAATSNVNHFLIAGPLRVGRAGSGADVGIAIHGDNSVSARHATIDLEAGPEGSVVVITDASTYGTHVNDVKLARKQPVRLAAGDTLRLADRTKFRLARAPLALHDAHGTDAAAAAMAAAVGLRPVPWGPDVTHCLVEEGGPLNAAAAAALLGGAALVTRGWLEEIHSRSVWSGELPPAEPHAPTTLAVVHADGTGGDALGVAAWEPPPEDALAEWVLVLLEEDAALRDVAECAGATCIAAWPPGTTPPDPGLGRALLAVTPEGAPPGAAAEAAAALGITAVPAVDLLWAAVTGDAGALHAAVNAFASAQRGAQRAALAALDEAAGGADSGGGGTQGGTQGTEEGGDGAVASPGGGEEVTLLDVAVGRHAPRRRPAASASSAGTHKAASPGKQPRSGAAQAAAGERNAPSPAGHGGSAGGGGGRKRRADAGAAQQGGDVASKRPRRGGAAAAANHAEELDGSGQGWHQHGKQKPKQRQAQGQDGAAAAVDGSGEGRAPVVLAALIVGGSSSRQPAPARGAVPSGVPNFKAFRRKGQPVAAARAPTPPVVQLVAVDDARRQDADAQAFAKEEQQRALRIKKAEELFNADIRPGKPPSGKAAAARRR